MNQNFIYAATTEFGTAPAGHSDSSAEPNDVYKRNYSSDDGIKGTATNAIRSVLRFNIGLSQALSESLSVLYQNVDSENLFNLNTRNGLLTGAVDGTAHLFEKTGETIKQAFDELKTPEKKSGQHSQTELSEQQLQRIADLVFERINQKLHV
jgi:hypothetical protein